MDFKARVLIVDDRRSEVWFIERVLQKEGFDIVNAFDGLEGLQKVEEERPDLIILDTIMPELDGLQVLHYVRQHSTVPVIMIPGTLEADLLREALFNGADGYVIKPFTPKDLLALIRRKLGKSASPGVPSG